MFKMKITFDLIRKVYLILASLTNLVTFIVVILCTSPSYKYFIEYTTLSRFFINLYTLMLLLILFLHTIYPKVLCGIIVKNMSFLSYNKGKIAIHFILSTMYWSTDHIPHFLFAAISFVSTLGMLIFEIIFDCNILGENTQIINVINEAKNLAKNRNINNNININVNKNEEINKDNKDKIKESISAMNNNKSNSNDIDNGKEKENNINGMEIIENGLNDKNVNMEENGEKKENVQNNGLIIEEKLD